MSLELVQDLSGHTDRVWSVAWSPDGSTLASSGGDKAIRLWAETCNKWTCISLLTKAHTKTIRRICWSPCGAYLAAASFDGSTSIWKRNATDNSWTSVVDLDGHDNEVKSVSWSSDGRYLATCGRDRTIWIWERSDAREDIEDEASGWDCSDILNDHTKDVKNVKWHPHHNILASCSYDESIRFFHKSGDNWVCFQSHMEHFSTVWSLDYSSSGEYLVSCSDNRVIRVWCNTAHNKLPDIVPNSWKCVSVVQGYHNRSIYDVSFCKFSDMFVSASGDNSIAIFRGNSGDQSHLEYAGIAKRSAAHDNDVNTVAWNPKRNIIASGSDDRLIKLWCLQDDNKGTKILTYEEQLVETILQLASNQKPSPSDHPNDCLNYELHATNYGNLLSLVHSLQCLQSELGSQGEDESNLRKHLDLDLPMESNRSPLDLSKISTEGCENSVTSIVILIYNNSQNLKYKFTIGFNEKQFALKLPRRSAKLFVVAHEMFLLEKTGDLFRIHEDGNCQFLLGHLFMFTDLRFMTDSEGANIKYVISSDRDEKIRISNYPDTFNIERYCFGHQKFIRRLLIVDDNNFISIDDSDNACLWNISKLKDLSSDELLVPVRHIELNERAAKKGCTARSNSAIGAR